MKAYRKILTLPKNHASALPASSRHIRIRSATQLALDDVLVVFQDFRESRRTIFECIEGWHNRKRIHSAIGYIPTQKTSSCCSTTSIRDASSVSGSCPRRCFALRYCIPLRRLAAIRFST